MPRYNQADTHVPSYTWSGKPTASEFGVGQAWFSDIGAMGYSDGNTWAVTHHVRTTTLRVGTFGDSTANAGEWNNPVNMSTELADITFGASGTLTTTFTPNYWQLPYHYPMARLVRNCGVGGDTTVLMAARDLAAASITRRAITDLMDASLDVVIYRGGSVNDLASFTVANLTDGTIDTIFAQHITILDRLIAMDTVVIDEGIAGYYFGTVGESADYRARQSAVITLNTMISTYIVNLNLERVVFLDPVGLTCNTDGTWITGLCTDGRHPTSAGAVAIAAAEAVILNRLFGKSSNVAYPGTNLATNPLMLTTTTDGFGTLATGFSIAVTNGTKQNYAIITRDNKKYQTAEYVPTGSGALTATITLPITSAGLNLTAGDVIGIEFDYFIETASGTGTVPSGTAICAIKTIKVAAGRVDHNYNPALIRDQTFKSRAVFNPIKMNIATADVSSLSVSIGFTTSTATPLVTDILRVGVGGVRAVKLI